MKIKCGVNEFDLNEKDIIFYNGACYQITTRTFRKDWGECYPKISTVNAKKLIKSGDLILINEEMKYITSQGKEVWHRYYRINQ